MTQFMPATRETLQLTGEAKATVESCLEEVQISIGAMDAAWEQVLKTKQAVLSSVGQPTQRDAEQRSLRARFEYGCALNRWREAVTDLEAAQERTKFLCVIHETANIEREVLLADAIDGSEATLYVVAGNCQRAAMIDVAIADGVLLGRSLRLFEQKHGALQEFKFDQAAA